MKATLVVLAYLVRALWNVPPTVLRRLKLLGLSLSSLFRCLGNYLAILGRKRQFISDGSDSLRKSRQTTTAKLTSDEQVHIWRSPPDVLRSSAPPTHIQNDQNVSDNSRSANGSYVVQLPVTRSTALPGPPTDTRIEMLQLQSDGAGELTYL